MPNDWDDLLGGQLRHGTRRLDLPMRYDPAEHALVFDLPDGAGAVWVAVELTGQIAGPRP